MSRLLLSGGAIAGIVVGSVAFVAIVVLAIIVPLKPFFSTLFSGVFVNPFKLASLRFRKVDINTILNAYILSKKSKLGIRFNDIEAHHLAGGNIQQVVTALVKARSAEVSLSFDDARSIDLTNHNIVEAVDSVVTPIVVEIPSIKATTKDNFELEVKANIAVKAKLESLVGGLGEDTLANKVSKYIVAKISSITNHKNATPYNLAQDILKSGLDVGNGYQLMSVDITSIAIVRDVGAILAGEDLERIKVQAQIEADRQKNYAILQEQQQKIRTQEMKTAVLEAEAEVPKAIAEAIRDGRFSVMDYYKLMNLQADTAMRRAMINPQDEPPRR